MFFLWILPFFAFLIATINAADPRQTGAKPTVASDCSISHVSATPPKLTTSIPSCSLQNSDPDQGILGRACICGSITLPPLTIPSATDESQSCSFTKLPSSNGPNPISMEHQYWTNNCQACTLIGGVADKATCTSVAGCTPTTATSLAVFVSNNSISIGDENNKNNGADLRTTVFSKLQALCPKGANGCDSKTNAQIDNIPTVVGDAVEKESLTFTITDSVYDTPENRDRMLAAAVATWQQAVAMSCKQVTFNIASDNPKCGNSPVKREGSQPVERWEDLCTYTTTLCAGPDHITVVLSGKAGAFSNHMDISVSMKLDGNSAFVTFICDLVIEELTAAATALAPELVEAEIFAGVDFQALCQKAIQGS